MDKSVKYLESPQHLICSPPLVPLPQIVYHSLGICTFPGLTRNCLHCALHKVFGGYTMEARPLVHGSKEVVPVVNRVVSSLGAVVSLYWERGMPLSHWQLRVRVALTWLVILKNKLFCCALWRSRSFWASRGQNWWHRIWGHSLEYVWSLEWVCPAFKGFTLNFRPPEDTVVAEMTGFTESDKTTFSTSLSHSRPSSAGGDDSKSEVAGSSSALVHSICSAIGKCSHCLFDIVECSFLSVASCNRTSCQHNIIVSGLAISDLVLQFFLGAWQIQLAWPIRWSSCVGGACPKQTLGTWCWHWCALCWICRQYKKQWGYKKGGMKVPLWKQLDEIMLEL